MHDDVAACRSLDASSESFALTAGLRGSKAATGAALAAGVAFMIRPFLRAGASVFFSSTSRCLPPSLPLPDPKPLPVPTVPTSGSEKTCVGRRCRRSHDESRAIASEPIGS
jgi:hypothetical protein